MISRNGKIVVTKCSPALWQPIIATGIVVGMGAVLGKELPEESRAAMRAASEAHKEPRQTVTVPEDKAVTEAAFDGATVTKTASVTVSEQFPEPKPTDETLHETDIQRAGAGAPGIATQSCPVCGKPLQGKQLYCSGSCRVKAHRSGAKVSFNAAGVPEKRHPKYMQIMTQILLGKSNQDISASLGVDRNAVARVRAEVVEKSDG